MGSGRERAARRRVAKRLGSTQAEGHASRQTSTEGISGSGGIDRVDNEHLCLQYLVGPVGDEERAGRAPGDADVTLGQCQQNTGGLEGTITSCRVDAGQHCSLGLIGDEQIDERKQVVVQGPSGGRVQDGEHSVGLRDLERSSYGVEGHLELTEQHRGVGDVVGVAVDDGRGEGVVGLRHHDDPVVAVVVDFDVSDAGRSIHLGQESGVAPSTANGVEDDLGDRIGADASDKGGGDALVGRGDRLIGPFAARDDGEVVPDERLASVG